MEELLPVLTVLLGHGPMIAAALVGIVLAALWWSRAGLSSLLVLLACLLSILLVLANTWMNGWYVQHAAREGGLDALRSTLALWGFASSLLSAVAFGLLLWAAFAGRRRSPPPPR